MANFANRSDAITVLREDAAVFMAAYRKFISDIEAARDFEYFNNGMAVGAAPLIAEDFAGENADLPPAQFYAAMAQVDNITALFNPARRKALAQISKR